MITITHSHLAGTLAAGSRRGDGTAVVFRAGGWRWSQHLTVWYLPRSRERDANRARIGATAQQLRGAGHEATVGIDDTIPSIGDWEADLFNRGMARAAALRARADQAAAREGSLAERVEWLRDRMPLGQPVLVDHPSAGVVRRHYEKVTRLLKQLHSIIGQVTFERTDETSTNSGVPPSRVNRNQVQLSGGWEVPLDKCHAHRLAETVCSDPARLVGRGVDVADDGLLDAEPIGQSTQDAAGAIWIISSFDGGGWWPLGRVSISGVQQVRVGNATHFVASTTRRVSVSRVRNGRYLESGQTWP
ncbi:Domain of uncharacterised function (DUF3560) [Mycobacteroides abscessus subsp. abscessus]|nr:Domain of uncharacterised function (DUF3560) [Mycobacteroides abscessus subsp. abscessus]